MKVVLNDIDFPFEIPEAWQDELGVKDIPKEVYAKDMALRTNPKFVDLVIKSLHLYDALTVGCWFVIAEIPDNASTWKILFLDDDDSYEVAVYVLDGEIHVADIVESSEF